MKLKHSTDKPEYISKLQTVINAIVILGITVLSIQLSLIYESQKIQLNIHKSELEFDRKVLVRIQELEKFHTTKGQ